MAGDSFWLGIHPEDYKDARSFVNRFFKIMSRNMVSHGFGCKIDLEPDGKDGQLIRIHVRSLNTVSRGLHERLENDVDASVEQVDTDGYDSVPKWTVYFNWMPIGGDTPPGVKYPRNRWVGTGHLFFDDKDVADQWRKKLTGDGMVAGMRPFHRNDWIHVGAAHK